MSYASGSYGSVPYAGVSRAHLEVFAGPALGAGALALTTEQVVASPPPSLLSFLDQLLTMSNGDLARFAFTCQQFLAGLISAWREEFLAAGILLFPLILVLIGRRMRP